MQDKFRLDLSDEEAVHYMQSLIDESVGALFAAVVEQIHKFAQVRFSTEPNVSKRIISLCYNLCGLTSPLQSKAKANYQRDWKEKQILFPICNKILSTGCQRSKFFPPYFMIY